MSDLARKLGITPGQALCVLDAPVASEALIRDICPPGVTISATPGTTPFDQVFVWVAAPEGLAERFAALERAIVPAGAVWAVLPNKRAAARRGIPLTWERMQAAALTTDLVDNKIVSLSDEEYATRFVIRKERRTTYS
ncbi:MAG TPA: hypothetical protein VKQ30_12455 [Ktedonobacterales bacterium]|nr:hypothetical protein [Ktedonobacterales bacterium]